MMIFKKFLISLVLILLVNINYSFAGSECFSQLQKYCSWRINNPSYANFTELCDYSNNEQRFSEEVFKYHDLNLKKWRDIGKEQVYIHDEIGGSVKNQQESIDKGFNNPMIQFQLCYFKEQFNYYQQGSRPKSNSSSNQSSSSGSSSNQSSSSSSSQTSSSSASSQSSSSSSSGQPSSSSVSSQTSSSSSSSQPNSSSSNNQSSSSNLSDESIKKINKAIDQYNSAHNQKDYATAFSALKIINANTQYIHRIPLFTSVLGEYYLYGLGVQKDEVKAHALFEQASMDGNTIADYHICNNYVWGKGVTENHQTAIKYCTSAANSNDLDSMSRLDSMARLGWIYASGTGTQNTQLAKEWTCKAAQKGHAGSIKSAKILNFNC